MKKSIILLTTLAMVGLSSCNDTNKKNEDPDGAMTEDVTDMDDRTVEQEQRSVEFKLEPKSDSKASGKVSFTEQNGMVTLSAKISGLEPGTHAIHIHEKADCSAPDGKSAGGHWNPTFEEHGKWGDDDGYHKGDIGNFEADDDGNGTVTMTTDEWCIGCDDETKNILGKSIIVHQGADDFITQPAGDAGARVSCGGIIQ